MILEKLMGLVSQGLLTEEELELIKAGKLEESKDLPKVNEEVVVENTPKEEVVEEAPVEEEVPVEEPKTEEVPAEANEEPSEEDPVVEDATMDSQEVTEEVVEENVTEENIEQEQEKNAEIEELKATIFEQKKLIDGLSARVDNITEVVTNLSVVKEIDKTEDFGMTNKPEVQKHEDVDVGSITARMKELSSR